MHSLIARFATVALGCAGFVGVAASRARAQACSDCFTSTQTFQCTMPIAVPSPGLRTCDLPSFNTTLGTLQSVTVSNLLYAQQGYFRFENLDSMNGCPGNPQIDAWVITADAQLSEPSSVVPLCSQTPLFSCMGPIPPVASFDGVLDFGVPGGGACGAMDCSSGSGYTHNCSSVTTSCPSVCITDPTRLQSYKTSGPGMVTFTLATTSNQVHSSNCASVAVVASIKVGATVTVVYNYRPNTAGSTFCFGDGSLATACPCAPPDFVPNPSGASDAGCANSFSLAGAKLLGLGTLAPDSLRLVCSIGTNYAGFAFL
ncbi:MAG: choice-of-anchor E domain-containing protein, partial [Planctomycetota bacterium]